MNAEGGVENAPRCAKIFRMLVRLMCRKYVQIMRPIVMIIFHIREAKTLNNQPEVPELSGNALMGDAWWWAQSQVLCDRPSLLAECPESACLKKLQCLKRLRCSEYKKLGSRKVGNVKREGGFGICRVTFHEASFGGMTCIPISMFCTPIECATILSYNL